MNAIVNSIVRFEALLKPVVFYGVVILLVLLNLFVWYGWSRSFNTPETMLLEGLTSQRNNLKSIVDGDCTSEGIRAYRRGETGPIAAGSHGQPEPANSNPVRDGFVGSLDAASVLVVTDKGFGSGFFIDANTVVTNRHVIEDAGSEKILVTSKILGGSVPVKIVSKTVGSVIGTSDFALLRLDHGVTGIKILAIASNPSPLQQVVAVGYPGSGIQSDSSREMPSPLFTSGDVSVVQPQQNGVDFVIHTAEISRGSSGGALVDRCGAIVGVNTFIRGVESRSESRRLFALSSDSLRKFLIASGQQFQNASVCSIGRGS
jgi:S1-C subfamily serine protease